VKSRPLRTIAIRARAPVSAHLIRCKSAILMDLSYCWPAVVVVAVAAEFPLLLSERIFEYAKEVERAKQVVVSWLLVSVSWFFHLGSLLPPNQVRHSIFWGWNQEKRANQEQREQSASAKAAPFFSIFGHKPFLRSLELALVT